MNQGYNQKISDLMRTTGTRLCLGIDPPLGEKSCEGLPFFAAAWQSEPVEFMDRFCATAIEAAQGHVASIKFQSAFFEAAGPSGYAILKSRMAQATAAGLSVILDVKRGDISTTMAAYGKAGFDQLGADAMTITPYMGEDVLKALLPWLQRGRGAYVVWMTSNAAARRLQGARLASGQTIAEMVFEESVGFAERSGIVDSLGFVLGTTRFAELSSAQLELLNRFSMLMPGIGPQGGKASDGITAFLASCPSAMVPMSRGLTGIGDSSQLQSLADVDSWESYGTYLVDRISMVAKEFAC